MDNILAVQQRLIPDLIEKMYRRFTILSTIYQLQPIGRRALSEQLHLTERVLRTEVNILKDEYLIEIHTKGMTVTSDGELVLQQLSHYLKSYGNLTAVSGQLQELYRLKKVIVVKGDSDIDSSAADQLGSEASRCLQDILVPDIGVTVTGGSTMASVAEHLNPVSFSVKFTPARGGLGEHMQQQANSIVASMAAETGGTYEVLYVPDLVSEATYRSLVQEPSVKRVLEQVKSAEVVVHGIGNAMKMADRRATPEEVKALLVEQRAAGEAFGYYFDKSGNIIHKVRTIGLQLEDLPDKQHIIAVAGGGSKAEAIEAYLKIAPAQTILITDEAVASYLLKVKTF
ncbi:sugar-binding transcriptional regulator [Macrococcus equipercicus]|uniref:Sugar-binding domain-containing protein n=1 Tax=Macrococcus equipercicus TaxID=69967 RepID=A0A9Q9BRL9_9STAP|nr:sugar-binding domain-containing protein [Macrococcus equipercicus]KAA1042498.1 hypothetical protein ERX35_001040 [Macrococcus equipercicus]UTH14359.1 hypothetical protein KFV11_03075 [Macrococcus equipercicus]